MCVCVCVCVCVNIVVHAGIGKKAFKRAIKFKMHKIL